MAFIPFPTAVLAEYLREGEGQNLYGIATAVGLLNAYASVAICAGLAIYYALPVSIEQQLSESG